jgi:hypothetical protein
LFEASAALMNDVLDRMKLGFRVGAVMRCPDDDPWPC